MRNGANVVLPLGFQSLRIAGSAEVIDEDAKIGKIGGEFGRVRQVGRCAVQIEFQTVLGEEFGSCEYGIAFRLIEQKRAAPANATEDRVRSEALQVRGKLRSRIEMADETDDGLLLGGEIENPLVVFHQRTGLDDDRFLHAMRRCDGQPVGRQHGAIELGAFPRPRHAARTRGIIKVRVRVDDPRRRCCGLHDFGEQSSGGGGLEETAAVHAVGVRCSRFSVFS